jgi:hypothetical protein
MSEFDRPALAIEYESVGMAPGLAEDGLTIRAEARLFGAVALRIVDRGGLRATLAIQRRLSVEAGIYRSGAVAFRIVVVSMGRDAIDQRRPAIGGKIG